ncbi:hypothetical protein ALC60_11065 [Trachymyrmex zeteki]|uniref:Uncharacterized protein n=1 Tax=Mycetomoellerius zeteki TaxID=64791 RepID=A0A151WPX8_9HYME|nr:hypothetical protein ALC60_11065 [Trachymyrmex zeteki]
MGRYKRVGVVSSSDGDAVVDVQGDPPLACRCWISQPRHHSLIPDDHAQDDPRNDRRKSRYLAPEWRVAERVNNPLLYYPCGFLKIVVNAFYKIAPHLGAVDDQIRFVVC